MFSQFSAVVEQGIEKQLHRGVQLSLSLSDAEYDVAFGESEQGVPLTAGSSLMWLSAAKPITAVAVLQLFEAGELDLHQPLSHYLPQWQGAESVRGDVNLWHLLTHSSPLNEVATGWPETGWDEVIQKICQAPLKPDWTPGERAAYLPGSSWFLLGEVIQRVSGMDYADYVQKQILDPLELTATRCVRSSDRPELSVPVLYERVKANLQPSEYTDRLRALTPAPGSSFRGPARELRLFYEALNPDRQLGKLLAPETLEYMTRRHRIGQFDETLQHKVDYGLGVIIDSKEYGSETVPYGFGAASSSRTFGHGGSQCAIGFTDPVRQRSVVIIANGRCGEGQHQRRFRSLLAALEEDLAG